MTPEQKHLVRTTWQAVAPDADTAAQLFYDRLFAIDPTTRPLFRSVDMPAQRRKLIDTLTVVVADIDDLGSLVPTIEALGRRHAGYGVNDAHYDSVGAALLWTLEQGLGAAWTPAAKDAWVQAFGLLAGVMRRAAAEGDVPGSGTAASPTA